MLPAPMLALFIIALTAVGVVIFVPKYKAPLLIGLVIIVGLLYFSGRLTGSPVSQSRNRSNQSQASNLPIQPTEQAGTPSEAPNATPESQSDWSPPETGSSDSEGVTPGVTQEISPTIRFLPPNVTCLIKDSFGPMITQWCSQVMAYAYRYNIDPNLVAAVMTKESNGRQWTDPGTKSPLVSSSGAVGVMQIIPRDNTTGKKWFAQNNEYEGERFSNCKDGEDGGREDSFNDHCRPYYRDLVNNPDLVIQYGIWLLRQYLDQSNGDVRQALMIYGPLKNGDVYADSIISNYKNIMGFEPFNHFPDDVIPAVSKTYQGNVYLIGDSLTEGVSNTIVSLFQSSGITLTVNYERGRLTADAVNTVGAMLIPTHQLVVVALGTNDDSDPAKFKMNFEDVMTRLINHKVIWLTIDRPGYEAFNQILTQGLPDYPNLTVADWAAFRQTNPQWIGTDSIHLTPEGYQARADFILKEVQKLLGKD